MGPTSTSIPVSSRISRASASSSRSRGERKPPRKRHSGAPKRCRARITWPFGSMPRPTTPTRKRDWVRSRMRRCQRTGSALYRRARARKSTAETLGPRDRHSPYSMSLRYGELLHDRARLDVDDVHHAVHVRRREQTIALGVVRRMEGLLAELGLRKHPAFLPVDPQETGAEVIGEDHERTVGHEEDAVLIDLLRMERIGPGEVDLLLDGLGQGVVDDHPVGGFVEEAGGARPDLALIGREVRVVNVADLDRRDLVRLEIVDAKDIALRRVRQSEPELVWPARRDRQHVLR